MTDIRTGTSFLQILKITSASTSKNSNIWSVIKDLHINNLLLNLFLEKRIHHCKDTAKTAHPPISPKYRKAIPVTVTRYQHGKTLCTPKRRYVPINREIIF